MGFLSNKIWVRIFLSHPVYDADNPRGFSTISALFWNFPDILRGAKSEADEADCLFPSFAVAISNSRYHRLTQNSITFFPTAYYDCDARTSSTWCPIPDLVDKFSTIGMRSHGLMPPSNEQQCCTDIAYIFSRDLVP